MAGLDLTQLWLDRDGASTLFGVTRQDRRTGAVLRLTSRNWARGGFAPQLELGFESQTSNIPLYDYQNLRADVTLTRSF